MKKYKYTVLDEGMKFEDAYSFKPTRSEIDIENLVLEAAEDYYWKDKNLLKPGYPISLEIFKEEGESLGDFSVVYSHVPSFLIVSENL